MIRSHSSGLRRLPQGHELTSIRTYAECSDTTTLKLGAPLDPPSAAVTLRARIGTVVWG